MASRFDDLCRTYRTARNTFLNYEDVCREFARDLVFGMVDYFGWPREQEITYIPLGEERDPNSRFYALSGAMRMDDQSFWHFGVQMTLHEGAGGHPVPFMLSFFIKKVENFFVVKLGAKGREIRIPEEKKDQLAPFYDAVYFQLKEFFGKHYMYAMSRREREFNFITLLDEEKQS